MATRGRRPKPTQLKVVAGTERPGRKNHAEPVLAPSIPSVPSHLSAEAKAEWRRVCKEMFSAGILSELDRGGLAAYCQAYGRWVQAEKALTRMAEKDTSNFGLMIKTTSGNAIQNPLVGSANKAMADMMRYATEFGMTPSARTRISALKAADNDDPFEDFVN